MANNGTLVQCDACKQTWTAQLLEEPRENGGVTLVFICPKCDHRYEIAAITSRGLRLRDQMNQLRRDEPNNTRQLRRLQERFQREYKGLATATSGGLKHGSG